MDESNKLIDYTSLSEMLYGDENYIKEFAEAAASSFSEFEQNYSKFLGDRDEVNLRKAGHKVKPVAQMLGLNIIIDEYEHSKTLLWDNKPEKDLMASISKMQAICSTVIGELKDRI